MAVTESDLTEEQKQCISKIEKWHHEGRKYGFGPPLALEASYAPSVRPRQKVNGPAGAGKSEIARFAIEACGYNIASSDVVKAAPTGKAAMVLRNKGIRDASTIHAAIYAPPNEVGDEIDQARARVIDLKGSLGGLTGEERENRLAEVALAEEAVKELRRRENDELEWVINSHSSVADAKFVVVDEAPMVSGKVQRDLESFGVPVLYLGDLFQLPPVDTSEDSVMFDRNGHEMEMDFDLTEIHRQAEGSAILRHSRDLRLNRVEEMNFQGRWTGEDGGTLIRCPAGTLTMDQLARAEQVICTTNDTRHRFNADMRAHLGRVSPYPEPGDKLICLKNNKDLQIVNGMMGAATSVYTDFEGRNGSFKVDVELEDGRLIYGMRMLVPYFQFPGDKDALYKIPGWSRRKHAHFDYANAITGHKAQGSQWRGGVILQERFGRDPVIQRRHRYTCVTRFELYLIIEI